MCFHRESCKPQVLGVVGSMLLPVGRESKEKGRRQETESPKN